MANQKKTILGVTLCTAALLGAAQVLPASVPFFGANVVRADENEGEEVLHAAIVTYTGYRDDNSRYLKEDLYYLKPGESLTTTALDFEGYTLTSLYISGNLDEDGARSRTPNTFPVTVYYEDADPLIGRVDVYYEYFWTENLKEWGELEEVLQKQPKERIEEAPTDPSGNTSQEEPKAEPKEEPKANPSENPGSDSKEEPKETIQENPVETPQDTSQESPANQKKEEDNQNLSQEEPKESPQDNPLEQPKDATSDAPKETQKEVSKDLPKDAPTNTASQRPASKMQAVTLAVEPTSTSADPVAAASSSIGSAMASRPSVAVAAVTAQQTLPETGDSWLGSWTGWGLGLILASLGLSLHRRQDS